MMPDDVSMAAMLSAYRNAKADLYFSHHPRLKDIAEYEENLVSNLGALRRHVLAGLQYEDSLDWVRASSFLGGDAVIPASLHIDQPTSEEFFSRSDHAWDRQLDEFRRQNEGGAPIAKFRQVSRCSIDFHVLSTLWLKHVGSHLDKALDKTSYGNRVWHRPAGVAPVGTFGPYRLAYKRWQDDSLRAIEDALLEGRELVVVTGDITSYFHELDPVFLQDERFLNVIGISLDDTQQALNRLFVKALSAWAERVGTSRGLPVGLPASSVVANAALVELDRSMRSEVRPLHYGRYVDDVMIVMRKRNAWDDPRQVRSWLGKTSSVMRGEKGGLRFVAPYLGESRIKFANSKNRVLWLEGASGLGVLKELRRSNKARTSEWRSLPMLPSRPGDAGLGIVSVLEGDGRPTDSLRKTERLSARRADFALHLRNIEAYLRDLDPRQWSHHRKEIYDAIMEVVLAPQALFQLFPYVGRVLQIAVACEDFDELLRMVNRLDDCINEVSQNAKAELKNRSLFEPESRLSHDDIVSRWRSDLTSEVLEHIASALPQGEQVIPNLVAALGRQVASSEALTRTLSDAIRAEIPTIRATAGALSTFDLAMTPVRTWLLPERLRPEVLSPRPTPSEQSWGEIIRLVDGSIADGLAALGGLLGLAPGDSAALSPLAFPTRPPQFHELPMMIPDLFAEGVRGNAARRRAERQSQIESVMRGFGVGHARMPRPLIGGPDRTGLETFEVGPFGQSLDLLFAVANWRSRESEMEAAIRGTPILSADRYRRLLEFVNGVIRDPSRPKYLVMPELSVPQRWFRRLAERLARSGISFVAGVEHIVDVDARGRRVVRNQVWANLVWYQRGSRREVLYKQDKQDPAIFERRLLRKLSGLDLVPEIKRPHPRVVVHCGLFFGILVCSEFTNIERRAGFRGKVDALIVPEFNRDIGSFGAMVESAALDVHCFIVQCNDRQFGDSRIRAPYNDRNARDVVRVRGGVTDVHLVGEIKVRTLRVAQTRTPPTTGKDAIFKPYMDGFVIHPRRAILLLESANSDD